ncbi:MAG: response regulator, partial [Candidatus Bathyarchaeia archaeon]
MSQSEPSPKPSAIRVLHVDDEETHLEYAKTFLEMADETFHIESVTSPEEALRLLESGTYDCVVSDFQMPIMDGVELARRVRETSDIPFILYTGRGSEEVAEAAFTVGIDDYLRKEVDPSHYRVLAKRIRA